MGGESPGHGGETAWKRSQNVPPEWHERLLHFDTKEPLWLRACFAALQIVPPSRRMPLTNVTISIKALLQRQRPHGTLLRSNLKCMTVTYSLSGGASCATNHLIVVSCTLPLSL